jgi:serine/threonine protein kinase
LKHIINEKYILLKILGTGGDSIVFRAKERDGGRTVALKFIINKCRNSISMMSVIREIQLMRRLNEISSMLYKA